MTFATIRPKRNRQAYMRVQQRVRLIIDERKRQEAELRRAQVLAMSIVSLIFDALNLSLPEEDKAFVDPSVIEQLMANHPDRIVESMKYLSADFTAEKMLALCTRTLHSYVSIEDWLNIRWAIVQCVESRGPAAAIPFAYCSFENEDFFFDEFAVINTKGQQSHTSWKFAPEVNWPGSKSQLVRPELPSHAFAQDNALSGLWRAVRKTLRS